MSAYARILLILVALGATATAPTSSQTFGIGATNSPAQQIPNLSGQWGRFFTYLEEPPSGPGPIANLSKRADGTIDAARPAGDYQNPILKPEAAAILRQRSEMISSGKVFPDAHNQCQPEPPPYLLAVQFGVQILQQRDRVTLVYLYGHKVRQVALNVSHPSNLEPTWQGHSVGHYEGDWLVIDTVGIKVGPLAMTDLYGTPHTEALHVVERYRLIDGTVAGEAQLKHRRTFNRDTENRFNAYGQGPIEMRADKPGLQGDIVVEDPGVFTAPWTARITYLSVDGEWPEVVCAENLQLGSGDTSLPKSDNPDF